MKFTLLMSILTTGVAICLLGKTKIIHSSKSQNTNLLTSQSSDPSSFEWLPIYLAIIAYAVEEDNKMYFCMVKAVNIIIILFDCF